MDLENLLVYEFYGEDKYELLDKITKYRKENFIKGKHKEYPLGVIFVKEQFLDSWLADVKIFSGWIVILEIWAISRR